MSAPQKKISDDVIEDIKSRLSIEAIVGRYVELARRGTAVIGRCPFHDEKSASFHVSDARKTAHCFGCRWHGDAIAFIAKIKGIPFPVALEELAATVGISFAGKGRLSERTLVERTNASTTKVYPAKALEASRVVPEGAVADAWERLASAPAARAVMWLATERGFPLNARKLLESGFAYVDAESVDMFPTAMRHFVAWHIGQHGPCVAAPIRSSATNLVESIHLRPIGGGKHSRKHLKGIPLVDGNGSPRGYGFAGAATRSPVVVVCEGMVDTWAAEAMVDGAKVAAVGAVDAGAFAVWAKFLPGAVMGGRIVLVPHLDGETLGGDGTSQRAVKEAARVMRAAGAKVSVFPWGHFFSLLERLVADLRSHLGKPRGFDLGDVVRLAASRRVPFIETTEAFRCALMEAVRG